MMLKFARTALAIALTGAVMLGAAGADAKDCKRKTALGEGFDASTAKFQVDEALLQATDWGAWASWMAGAGTPGYSFGARSYSCKSGGVGVTCRGSATICKL